MRARRHQSNRRSTAVASAVCVAVENLEPRRLFATSLIGGLLTVTGTAGDDMVNLWIAGNSYNVSLNNGVAEQFGVGSVDSILIQGGDGNDWVFLNGAADPVQFNGGIGNDILTAGMGFGMDAVQGDLSFDGGAGTDRVDFRDDHGTTGRTINLSPTGLTATGWGNSFTFFSCDGMHVVGGSGQDTFNLAQLPANMYADVFGSDGQDTLNLATGTLDTIAGQVYFTGGNDFDFVNLDDQTTARNDNYSITATLLTRFSNGVAPFGGLDYTADQVMLLAGAGNNQVIVQSTAAGPPGSGLWIQGGNGNDTLFAGTGNLDNLAGSVHFDGNGGADAVKIDDSGANTPRNFDVSNASVTLTGNGTTFGGIYYTIAAEPVELNGPSSAFLDNTYRVNGTASGQTVTINAGTGDDSFILGGGSPVNGQGSNLENLAGNLILNCGSGGGGGGGGGGGATFDLVAFNDVGNGFGDAFTINATSVTRQFWTGSVTFNGAEQLVVRAGDGNNTMNVQSIGATTSVTVMGGGGDDTIQLAQQAQTLAAFAGNHAFFGGEGSDSITLFDAQTNVPVVWYINPASVQRLPENTEPSSTYAYEEFESLALNAGLEAFNGDTIVVTDTPAATSVTVSPGSGPDTISVIESSGETPVTILANPVNGIAVTVNTDDAGSAAVRFPQSTRFTSLNVRNGGTASVPAGANALLHVTQSLNVFAQGRLDLTDNDLAVDYTGASPIGSWTGSTYSGLTGQIRRAHNGGGWDGLYGITTSAPLAASGLTTLAITEAGDALGISGSQTGVFDGATVDATTVLIKYTYAGDVNLDGQVTGDDYSAIDFAILVPDTRRYANGDYNFDGVVSGDDYSAIDFAILAQGWRYRLYTRPRSHQIISFGCPPLPRVTECGSERARANDSTAAGSAGGDRVD